MSLVLHAALLEDIDQIVSFEQGLIAKQFINEIELQMHSWSAKWRKEYLEYYFKLGWSFIAKDSFGSVHGYFLAQPLLFFNNQTQSLWVDHLTADTSDAKHELCDLAVRLAKDKHFQRVYFLNSSNYGLDMSFSIEQSDMDIRYIKTTKVMT